MTKSASLAALLYAFLLLQLCPRDVMGFKCYMCMHSLTRKKVHLDPNCNETLHNEAQYEHECTTDWNAYQQGAALVTAFHNRSEKIPGMLKDVGLKLKPIGCSVLRTSFAPDYSGTALMGFVTE